MGSSNNQLNNDEDVPSSPENSRCNKRKGRGTTILPEIIKNRRSGVRILVQYNDRGQPIGVNKAKFVSYLGVLARTMVPIAYTDWFKVPRDLKEKLRACVELAFNVDPMSKKKVISSISTKWRTFKTNLAKLVRTNKSDSDLISKPPEIYAFIEQKHWDTFIQKILSEEFEKMSKVQREKRLLNKYDHRIGRKGYAQFEHELMQPKKVDVPTCDLESEILDEFKGRSLDRSVMWKLAHQNKNGKYDDEEIIKQATKIDDISKQVKYGSLSIQGSDDILTLALCTSEPSGRVRGVGGFVTPSAYFHVPRRGNHSRCKDKHKSLQVVVSQLQIEINALKQSTPRTPHSDYAGSNTFKSDNMCIPQRDPVSIKNMVKTKDDMPPIDPQPELLKSKQCKLALESLDNVVAHGTMYDRVEPLQTMHTILLDEANVRVSVDVAIVKDAHLPIPIPGEATTVGEAVGYQVAWPKKFVLVDNEGAPINLGRVGKKKRAPKHHEVVVDEVTSRNVDWENNLVSIQSFATFAKHLNADDAFKIGVDAEIFGEKVDIHIQKVDMEYMSALKEITVSCIMVFMSHMYEVMKDSNKHRSFLFVNPYSISAKNNPSENSTVLLARRLEDAKPGKLLFAPCNIGYHWVLLVIEVSSSIVYYLDSLNNEVPLNFRLLIHTSLKIYETNKGKRSSSPDWKVVQFGGKKTYTKAELDKARVEWINFVMKKYQLVK